MSTTYSLFDKTRPRHPIISEFVKFLEDDWSALPSRTNKDACRSGAYKFPFWDDTTRTMSPTSDTSSVVNLADLREVLEKELELFNQSDLVTVVPVPMRSSNLAPSFGYLSVPIDIRNYLLSPPPPPNDYSWKPRVESPPVTHEEGLYRSIFSSKKKVEKAKKKGCKMEGVTYFIGEHEKQHKKMKKKNKDGKGTPKIVVHLCED